MSLATRVKTILDNNLRKYMPEFDVVYKRTTTVTGDELIGRTSKTYVDVKLDPQPLYARPKRAEVGGFHRYKMVFDDSVRQPAVELVLFISSTALSKEELENKRVSILFVDTTGIPEIFEIFDYDYVGVQGSIVAWRVGIRSVKR